MNTIKLFLLIAIFQTVNSLSAQELNWISYKWMGDSISGKYYDKLAIMVPVTFDNLPYKFQMQLDLGAVVTTVYGNTIDPFLGKHPLIKSKLDTSLVFFIQSQKNYMLKDIDLSSGNTHFGNVNIGLFRNFGDTLTSDSIMTPSVKLIGTIAPELFKGKVLIIDFPNERLSVTEIVPEKYQKASFVPYKERDGRIFIPLVISGKQQDLLFDTGSSIFALMTTEHRASEIGEKSISDSLKISSWGNYYYVYGKKIKSKVLIGNKLLKPSIVYFDKQKKLDFFYSDQNIWGITGNAYFLNNTVIIDYKNKLFGVY